MKPNEAIHQTAVPPGLLAWLLLIPLRGQKPCQKQAAVGDRGRSTKNMRSFSIFAAFLVFSALLFGSDDYEDHPLLIKNKTIGPAEF